MLFDMSHILMIGSCLQCQMRMSSLTFVYSKILCPSVIDGLKVLLAGSCPPSLYTGRPLPQQ